MNRSITLVSFASLLLLTGYIDAEIMPSSVREGSISLGFEHTHSDNIRKTNTNQKSGYEQRVDLNVSYQNHTATNNSLLDYGLYYSHYSEADIEDESDIAGSLTISQQIFSKNLLLDLSHFRHSYLLDKAGVDLPNNNGNRDVFTVSPLWRLPYSKRAGFETRYTYTAVRLSDDKQQNTDRNGLSLSWYHDLNNKMTYRLSSQYSEVDFLLYELTYEQINVDMSLAGNLRNGSYLAKAGYSRLAILNRYEEGGIFQFSYHYRFQKNTLGLSVQRELTDSSLGLGKDTPDSGDINFDGTQLLWIDRVSLDHNFFAFNARFTNTNSLYYQQETPLITREVKPRSGISTQLSWKHTALLTTRFSASYSQTYIEKEFDKQQWLTSLSSEYRFHPKLTFSLTAQYEEQLNNEQMNGYDETRLIATVRFSH
ncbi:hypothetical protein [Psychromonas hadalis]|uniref:hypothetical protein n=1 Tax=Psychromonas hadalis TaxID=211669 RepID=UPI0012EBB3F5|nr:hypothetical protein [Psychromonas hadalis]